MRSIILHTKRSCLFVSAKKTAKRKRTKEFCLVSAKKLSASDKSSTYIFIIKKCGWKNLAKNKNAVSASQLKILAETLQDVEREDGEYCEELWQ